MSHQNGFGDGSSDPSEGLLVLLPAELSLQLPSFHFKGLLRARAGKPRLCDGVPCTFFSSLLTLPPSLGQMISFPDCPSASSASNTNHSQRAESGLRKQVSWVSDMVFFYFCGLTLLFRVADLICDPVWPHSAEET